MTPQPRFTHDDLITFDDGTRVRFAWDAAIDLLGIKRESALLVELSPDWEPVNPGEPHKGTCKVITLDDLFDLRWTHGLKEPTPRP